MIHVDAFDIAKADADLFFNPRYVWDPNHQSRYVPEWIELHGRHRFYRRTVAEAMLEGDFSGKPDPDRILWAVEMPDVMIGRWLPGRSGWQPTAQAQFTSLIVRLVRVPCCECCGANPWGIDKAYRKLTKVEDGTWRCERHKGRNPCVAEGCGKTRAGDRHSSTQVVCGVHWRMVRMRLRRLDRALWRRQKKLGGWNYRLNDIYWRNWERIIADVRAKVSGKPVEVDVETSSGPPPAALIAELQRLGL